MNLELEEIRVQKRAIKKSLEALQRREQELCEHERNAAIINADDAIISKDASPEAVNNIMSQSAGYVTGFTAALNTIICALANEFRDIPMTESELYMLVELGEMKERAWLKDDKQRKILEKNGWKMKLEPGSFVYVWQKERSEGENKG